MADFTGGLTGMNQAKKSTWPQIAQWLNDLEKSELVQLIYQLFNLSDDVALFLAGGFQPDQDRDSRLAPYRSLIKREFFPGNDDDPRNDDNPRLDFTAARMVIDLYSQATGGDTQGVVELHLYCVEMATILMNQANFGYARFYSDLADMVSDFISLMWRNRELYPQFAGRIRRVREQSDGFGYGYSDYAYAEIYTMEINLENEEEEE